VTEATCEQLAQSCYLAVERLGIEPSHTITDNTIIVVVVVVVVAVVANGGISISINQSVVHECSACVKAKDEY